MTEAKDYRDTVFLPKTDFPMKAGLPQKEPGILAKWEADGLYHRLREARAGREKFILHDGPPYANGDMHIGHALNHILKDMVCRTQTLLGKDAPYVPGWDCHGLPIEWKVEEQYRKKKLNKDEVPVKEFRAECRAYAQHWVNVQREQVKRLGVLGHWEKPYLTMDFDSEATIVAELLKFAESGQLYRGAKPVMWSPVEKTALAEAEVEYEDITSTQIDVAFEISNWDKHPQFGTTAHAVIWTTTPWTIPVNQAISYGSDIDYVGIMFDGEWSFELGHDPKMPDLGEEGFHYKLDGQVFFVAEALQSQFVERVYRTLTANLIDPKASMSPEVSVVWRGKGSEFDGAIARHPMHHLGGFFAKPRPFLPGDFVTTDSGTGLVHMAPDHGEDDFDLCKANGIEPQFAVEGDGKYRADWAWLGGQGSVINPKFNSIEGRILKDLQAAGALLAHGDYKHSYPHSWRSKAKVIYRCTPQWFVPMDRPLPQGERDSLAQAKQGEGTGTAGVPSPLLAAPAFPSPLEGEGGTLRQRAMQAIANTRFIPEKGRNRIGSMVEGRPDWVLSRQRAWGVPITLFVDRKTGQYLNDPAVNARIVAAIKAEGVDGWCDENAKSFLGETYDLADYERVTDILDVWFDSGCTHVFTLESGKWPELSWPADLYLEGSDQHRGWFQSSLLQSCGTRGRAPYDAVLTHGFTMDAKGMKMSKSVGNTVDPLKVMETNGADIIRLWALSVDFTEDHRIGDEILKGVADQYRKLRNTFRYMLGALDGFDGKSNANWASFAQGEMPELECYILHLLADMDAKLRTAITDYDFNTYVRLLSEFANNDLSAFFFDIRKDRLYCDARDGLERRAYLTVLAIVFDALVRYAAPVLVFTAEEVWQSRYPGDEGSVHLLEMPNIDQAWLNPDLANKWLVARNVRGEIIAKLEEDRREKRIGSSLEAKADVVLAWEGDGLGIGDLDLAELAIVSNVTFKLREPEGGYWCDVTTSVTEDKKCGRCWRHLPEVVEDGALCGRCEEVVHA